ncbi:SDR family NAD(P)-dependent oxidoreductase [Pedobacter panaciterrae]
MEKVWLITGCSTGFGRELAKQVLELGYKAGVAARNIADVEDIVKQYPETSIAITLDVTRQDHITDAVKQLTEIFGRVDVLVNNAGIGYFGSVEASDEHETRRMFDINFFGLANMTKAVLPHMRKQRSGHIINIASIGGLMAFPALAYYNATKFAVDGFSESLAKETAPLA